PKQRQVRLIAQVFSDYSCSLLTVREWAAAAANAWSDVRQFRCWLLLASVRIGEADRARDRSGDSTQRGRRASHDKSFGRIADKRWSSGREKPYRRQLSPQETA